MAMPKLGLKKARMIHVLKQALVSVMGVLSM